MACNNQIAITGMGCMAGAGTNIDELWGNFAEGRVNCAQVPEYLFHTILEYPVFAAPENCFTERARGLVSATAPRFRREQVSRTILLACSATAEALDRSGISPDSLKGKRVGIALGTTVGCTFHNEEYYQAWRDGKEPDLAPVQYYLAGNVASALHRILGTTGPSAVITNACASGTDAIGVARNWLAAGLCDIAIAGGADELSRVAYNGFVSLMLSDSEPCRPFSGDRKGLNLGEGAGVVVLERFLDTEKRGGEPLGRIRGYGCAADAWHPTAPHPEGRGLKNALAQALRDAGPDVELALINAHGTGTRANDVAETSALAEILEYPEQVAIVSTKGVTGHTLGAAGGIEAIFTLMSLRAGYSPGTVGCEKVDLQLPVKPLARNQGRELSGKIGLSESLAFGGGNSVLIMEAL
ncbi:MAG: beta-ketoacyl-[acyl-carrier-protein] synthase family protein [Proteobacteria bacterium]|nr:beta-ketoacyl-[acyl-carrier-protein] synthase family protein [Pseudomonadota bacterium]MBU1739159.1 beta-ketoacyl-[acyl-carrier-protein] synthase family protein [Pseudomonadota bacterium]